MPFAKNVFVNCPFDSEYVRLLQPLLFTIVYLGFEPRIALESKDSGTPRIDKIVRLIQGCKYAIHDLSRSKARSRGEYFRLNMPFELGVDFGCREFKSGQAAHKRILVLGDQPYDYQKALSDISGSDIEAHANQPDVLVEKVRDWLNQQARLGAVGAARIFDEFNFFMAANETRLMKIGFSPKNIENLATNELIEHMREWRDLGLTARACGGGAPRAEPRPRRIRRSPSANHESACSAPRGCA